MNSTYPSVRRVLSAAIVLVAAAGVQRGSAQAPQQFHRTITVTSAEPVVLDVKLARGELQILYSRDGEVAITGSAHSLPSVKGDANAPIPALAVEQNGNHIQLRDEPNPAGRQAGIDIVYRIAVPYRTEVTSEVHDGKQFITGVMGPVKAVSTMGDIRVSYVSGSVSVHAEAGNVDLEVIGEHAAATTGIGNISCTRAVRGVDAETTDGNITLLVVGPSTAKVKKGAGTIEVGGARGSLVGITDAGSLHVKAVPHADWQLSSTKGNISVELPPSAPFELDAMADSGEIVPIRHDLQATNADPHHFHGKVIGGSTNIQVHTDSGRIVIQ